MYTVSVIFHDQILFPNHRIQSFLQAMNLRVEHLEAQFSTPENRAAYYHFEKQDYARRFMCHLLEEFNIEFLSFCMVEPVAYHFLSQGADRKKKL